MHGRDDILGEGGESLKRQVADTPTEQPEAAPRKTTFGRFAATKWPDRRDRRGNARPHSDSPLANALRVHIKLRKRDVETTEFDHAWLEEQLASLTAVQ